MEQNKRERASERGSSRPVLSKPSLGKESNLNKTQSTPLQVEKRILINSVDKEQCRIAIIEGKHLSELEIESDPDRKLKGNIYKGKVVRVEPSLQAAFIDLGTDRNGFIQINDIHPAYYSTRTSKYRVNIQDVLKVGQDLIVQVVKEERDMKGATLTTYLSLPGRYLVVTPGSDRGGISRKINDSEQRMRLKNLRKELEIPVGMGVIIRTAGLDRSMSDLGRDLTNQLKVWEEIVSVSQSAQSASLIYKESDATTRFVRDYFTPEVREIVVDDPKTYVKVRAFVESIMPRYRSRVVQYQTREPIFTKYGIEEQVASTLESSVLLPSGGSIVLEQLEALVAIDVNSGKATSQEGIESTALKTNLEAADEIARQLRLRDLGGLIVIDFIDMLSRKNQVEVERRLRTAVKNDKARIEIGRLSKFGLVEMSRQRIRASLASQSHIECNHCHGLGLVKNHDLVALDALRKIQSAVVLGNVGIVKVKMSQYPALFLLNQKKTDLVKLEEEFNIHIYILSDPRFRSDQVEFEMEPRRTKKSEPPPTLVTERSMAKEIEKKVEELQKEGENRKEEEPTLKLSQPKEEDIKEVSKISQVEEVTKTPLSLFNEEEEEETFKKNVNIVEDKPTKEEVKPKRPRFDISKIKERLKLRK